MDCQKTGDLIYKLRKEKKLTQKQLADQMNISDKTISKWERGQGCPDISLIPELAELLGINVDELLAGEVNLNELVKGNMNQTKFYVCPYCQNVLTATGEAGISCCGKRLQPLAAKKSDEDHKLDLEPVEDELFITTKHKMQKAHYISFVAYVRGDRILLIKQYPEWNLEVRLQKKGHGRLYFYCSQDGLYYQTI